MKTVNTKLIKDLPKREAKYIRVLRHFNKGMTFRQLFNGQIPSFKDNEQKILEVLEEQGFKQHIRYNALTGIRGTLTQEQQTDNSEYQRAWDTLLQYYPEYTYYEGQFAQMMSRHFSGRVRPPKNLPVTRTEKNGMFYYKLKPQK